MDNATLELIFLAAKQYALILPTSQVPPSWLQELTAEDFPALASHPKAWDFVMARLVSDGALLCEYPLKALVCKAGPALGGSATPIASGGFQAMRSHTRTFCTSRIEAIRKEEQRVLNAVITGDPETMTTAWTVPPTEKVLYSAAKSCHVDVVTFGDGSYSVRYMPPTGSWEKDCLKAFAAQEFAGHDFAGIEWALRSGLLTADQLETAKDRVGNGHLHTFDSDHAALAGLYWLRLADKRYGEGWSSRSSFYLCTKAVEILQRLVDQNADDRAIELLANAKKAAWCYDD